MSWQVEFQYTSGGSWYDITEYVFTKSIRRTWRKHNRLKPTTNSLDFEMFRDTSTITNLLTNDDVQVRVHKDGADYFTGEVRHNFRLKTAQNIKPIKIECVDYSERLNKRMTWTGAWSNYKVIDTSNTSQSIVHQLLSEEGSGWGVSVADIDRTVPLYVNVDGVDDVTYWEAITDLLFQFGYVWDINMSGEFTVYDLFPASTTKSSTFDGDSIRGDLTIKKELEEYDGVAVKWWTQNTVQDALVFQDTTNGGSDKEMSVSLSSGDTYPGNDSDRPFYAEYEYKNKEIVQVANPTLSFSPSTLTQNTFSNEYRRAEVEIENATGSEVDLTEFRITGDVTYRATLNISRSENWSSSAERQEIEAKHIYQLSDAERLSTGLRRYFQYSDFSYRFASELDVEPGTFVDVDDANLGISNRCVVIEQRVVSEATDTTKYKYVCEGITAYSSETTSDEGGIEDEQDHAFVTSDKLVTGSVTTRKLESNAINWPEDTASYWPLDEDSGATLQDVQGDSDGTAYGTISRTDGPSGGAIETSGAGYLDFGDYDLFADAAETWTVSLFFYASSSMTVVDNGNLSVYVTNSGDLRLVIRGADNTIHGAYADNNPHHLVIAWDGSAITLLIDTLETGTETTVTTLEDSDGNAISDTDGNSIDPQYKYWEVA